MADLDIKAAICNGFARYLESADFSDFTIICGEHKWAVHRFCLSLHSSVLATACNSNFSVLTYHELLNSSAMTSADSTQEGQQKTYNLSEYSKDQVTALIRYFYTFDYETAGEDHGQRMCFHVELIILADKYNIPGLKKLATSKFNAIMDKTQHAAELAAVVILAYGAESATVEVCKAIARLIARRDAFMPGGVEGNVMEELADSYPRLAVQIIKAMKEHSSDTRQRRFWCPDCDKLFDAPKGHSSSYCKCQECEGMSIWEW